MTTRTDHTGPTRDLPRPRRWVKLLIALLVVLAMILVVDKVRSWLSPSPTVGHWSSAQAQQDYRAAYDDLLADLQEPEKRYVDTDFGSAHVLVWEVEGDEPPVLLLPGHSSGAPMWAENLPDWIGERTIIAPDPFGDAGLSSQRLPLRAPADQATWISQLLEKMSVDRVHVVGHSFGGANAAIFGIRHPEQAATLTLLEPVMVIETLPAAAFFWATLTQLPVPQSWKDRALAEIGGTTVEEVQKRTPMSRMIDAGAGGYATALPTPTKLSDEQWQSLDLPVRVDIAGTSSLAGGQAAADRIGALLPRAETNFWPDATHSLPMDKRAELGPQLLAFWAGHD